MVKIVLRSKFSMKMFATIGETGDPIARPAVILQNFPRNLKLVSSKQMVRSSMMTDTEIVD